MRILGIDYGERRIGLALSDPTATLARPLRTIEARGAPADRAAALADAIAALAADPDGLAGVVVGLPRSLDGHPHGQTARVETFVHELRRAVDLPVVMQDERLSSVEADERLAVRERSWRRRKTRLDAAAAAVILQDYLDAASRPRPDAAEQGRW